MAREEDSEWSTLCVVSFLLWQFSCRSEREEEDCSDDWGLNVLVKVGGNELWEEGKKEMSSGVWVIGVVAIIDEYLESYPWSISLVLFLE
jgi:hypothetical protein